MASALLLALAVGVLLSRPSAHGRLRGLVPRPVAQQRRDLASGPAATVLPVVSGVVLWWVVGGVAGAVLGLALAAVGPRLIARARERDESDQDELDRQLPLALDLLGACLVGGATLSSALRSVSAAFGGPVGDRLLRVAAALAVGCLPEEAFRELGTSGTAGAAARALRRACQGGTPVAGAVTRVASEARRQSTVTARKRAKRAGVMAVGPLGACFLPAFVLVGVVPVIAGLAGPLLRNL